MSILIKGIEMPKNCRECFACKAELSQEKKVIYVCCFAKTDCPLVPVPSHGRLGDLDKLVEKIDGIWDCNDMVFKPDDHCCNVPEDCKGCKWAQTKDCIQRMVENAPTIIPADESDMDSFIHIFEEDDEEDEMDSFIRFFKD